MCNMLHTCSVATSICLASTDHLFYTLLALTGHHKTQLNQMIWYTFRKFQLYDLDYH
jgi:hypothetical protein